MSAEMTLALVSITIVVLFLLTYAAFRYVPMTLAEEEPEGQTGMQERSEDRFAD